MGTTIIGSILAVIVIGVIAKMVKDKQAGKSPCCGGDCKHCGGSCH